MLAAPFLLHSAGVSSLMRRSSARGVFAALLHLLHVADHLIHVKKLHLRLLGAIWRVLDARWLGPRLLVGGLLQRQLPHGCRPCSTTLGLRSSATSGGTRPWVAQDRHVDLLELALVRMQRMGRLMEDGLVAPVGFLASIGGQHLIREPSVHLSRASWTHLHLDSATPVIEAAAQHSLRRVHVAGSRLKLRVLPLKRNLCGPCLHHSDLSEKLPRHILDLAARVDVHY